MKRLLFLSAIIAGSLSLQTAKAQIGVHLNVNLGARPVYVPAPVAVPDDYYYLPDAEAYYSVPEHVYYYQSNGYWTSGRYLPGRFRGYDYGQMRHFAIHESRPYLRNDYYSSRYRNPQFAARNYGNYGGRGFDNSPRGRNDYRRPNYGNDHRDQGPRGYDDRRGGRGGRY